MTGSTHYTVETDDSRSGASTRAESRVYNARLALALIRRHGALSKIEISRLTGLSPHSISTIITEFEEEELVLRGEPIRGRIGQPSTPFRLNPTGAFGAGLSIGRREAQIMVIDFMGEAVFQTSITYAEPTPELILGFASDTLDRIGRDCPPRVIARLSGVGISYPLSWFEDGEAQDLSPETRALWLSHDVRKALEEAAGLPVYLFNTGMVCAAGEMLFGNGRESPDFLTVYVGHAISAGIVLDHSLYPGRNKRAGDIACFSVTCPESGKPVRLDHVASQTALAGRLNAVAPGAFDAVMRGKAPIGPIQDAIDTWLDDAGAALSETLCGICTVMDVDHIILDSPLPQALRQQLTARLRALIVPRMGNRPNPFDVSLGPFGGLAPVVGAASLPFMINFSTDKDILFKD